MSAISGVSNAVLHLLNDPEVQALYREQSALAPARAEAPTLVACATLVAAVRHGVLMYGVRYLEPTPSEMDGRRILHPTDPLGILGVKP